MFLSAYCDVYSIINAGQRYISEQKICLDMGLLSYSENHRALAGLPLGSVSWWEE